MFVKAVVVMGMSQSETKCVLNGARIDTGSNDLNFVGLSLLHAVCVADIRIVEPKMDDAQKRYKRIGEKVITVQIILFYFHFGGRE